VVDVRDNRNISDIFWVLHRQSSLVDKVFNF